MVIRNPKTVPGNQFTSLAARDGETTEDRMARTYAAIAGLIIGWRVWDPTVPVKVDDAGNEIHDAETEPRLLPLPATGENVAKLPLEIQTAIMAKVTDAANPPQSPAESTGKAS